ncbi:zinc-dependent alcohol dehydrogenase [Tessaracoccus palaemonis]|uniref:Alcohol dehydrogenase catalytic domain-containing protein n=1 Tax=Tessaracoccus palaemonis TaxID=2829499 RepID=A0ABX8SEP4_9ACTN|nr:alcohol dehydrogenase catalytic domain-containing protein [Tessaracoccus palaemonis]QXT61781.1 alcohol dehydrogenase catalytic domain-containing protein [Tessaracoccus palaemonis]
MRAFVITAPGRGEVQEVATPRATPGSVVVAVERVGVCGTDAEFFGGEMAYLATGEASYPMRIGHEWCGRVIEVGEGVSEDWLGRRVTADTMLGCGSCRRCTSGRQHLCEDRFEIGVRRGFPGALAERIAVPAKALVTLGEIDALAGAMVEPGGNALRSVRGAKVKPGDSMLVIGAGAIGLLVAQIARAKGADVHLLGRSARSLDFARTLGFTQSTTLEDLDRSIPFDSVVDASNAPGSPALATELVEPGGRIVLVGLSGTPSLIDTRTVALADVTAVGVLSASGGLEETVELYASGAVDPRPLVAATVGLGRVAAVLAGQRPEGAGAGPKIHVDPTLL